MPDPVKPNAMPKSDRTIGSLLHSNELSRLEQMVLLAHALGMTRAAVLANADRHVTEPSADRFRRLVRRRLAGEPIAYLVGSREFYSLDFTVTSDVLIPRPETELLVDAVLDIVPPADSPSILELGTGSGAVAVAVARHRPAARIVATDLSLASLDVARANARHHGADIEFVHSDWYAALGTRRFDVIVSNPPYIAAADPHLAIGDLRFEPRQALAAGTDGLAAIRLIIGGARERLSEKGRLVFEHGFDQGEAARSLMRLGGFADVATLRDLAGRERVCVGTSPAAPTVG